MRDPQGEGFIMVLIRVLLPPDFELSDGAPAGGEADVANLRDGDGFSKTASEGKHVCGIQGGGHLGGELPAAARPLEDQRLIGRVETVAHLEEKEQTGSKKIDIFPIIRQQPMVPGPEPRPLSS